MNRRGAIKQKSDQSANRSRSSTICRRLLYFDIYHKPLDLVLPDDTTSYRTLCGSICSIITIVTIALYAVLKIESLNNRTDPNVQPRLV